MSGLAQYMDGPYEVKRRLSSDGWAMLWEDIERDPLPLLDAMTTAGLLVAEDHDMLRRPGQATYRIAQRQPHVHDWRITDTRHGTTGVTVIWRCDGCPITDWVVHVNPDKPRVS